MEPVRAIQASRPLSRRTASRFREGPLPRRIIIRLRVILIQALTLHPPAVFSSTAVLVTDLATPLTTGTSVQQNTLQNNDVGVFISNLSLDNNNQCSLPITATNVVAKYNMISNIAVTNVSGPNLLGYPGGYQAGISDEGNSDQIIKNQICGIGYTSVTPPPYLSQIDVVATNPIAYGNTTCILVAKTSASPSPQKVKRGHVRNVSSPIK